MVNDITAWRLILWDMRKDLVTRVPMSVWLKDWIVQSGAVGYLSLFEAHEFHVVGVLEPDGNLMGLRSWVAMVLRNEGEK